MEFDSNKVRSVVNEDRVSGLPDELINQILSRFDTKFAVQTCILSSRWKHIWKSLTCLDFSSLKFDTLAKFSKFVNHVLSHRNHQIDVSSVKLSFSGAASQVFVRKIANYAFSHNVQELSVCILPKRDRDFPACFFSSVTLKELSLRSLYNYRVTPKTPWDFPALTTLNLCDIMLCDNNLESVDLFSKCVNLKNLVLENVHLQVKEFHIITPGLLNLTIIECINSRGFHVIAPQVENLTVKGYQHGCTLNSMKATLRLSSLCYSGRNPPRWFKDCFHSLNEVSVSLLIHNKRIPYEEKDAREVINMLQELHGARCLTLNLDIVECISSFPDLLSHHPSPFSNLISVNIISTMRQDGYKINMSTEARNFLLENSPSATFIMDLPEPPPTITKAMNAKEAREKKAKLVTEIESHMKQLQELVEHENTILAERKQATEKIKVTCENFMAELQEWTNIKMTQSEEVKKFVGSRLGIQLVPCLQEIQVLTQQTYTDLIAIESKKVRVRSLLENFPNQHMAVMEARYSSQLEETETVCVHLRSITQDVYNFVEKLTSRIKNVTVKTSAIQDVSGNKLPQASQPSSFSALINTTSSSSINPAPSNRTT